MIFDKSPKLFEPVFCKVETVMLLPQVVIKLKQDNDHGATELIKYRSGF